VRQRFANAITNFEFHRWFGPTHLLEDAGDVIVVGVPRPEIKRWLRKHYGDRIAEALRTEGRADGKVEFRIVEDADPSTPRLQMKRASDITPEPVTWLWSRRIAAGKITLLMGDPEAGKTFLACEIAARVSTGMPLPGSRADTAPARGDVLYFTAEDGHADTIVQRLIQQRAKMSRIHVEVGGVLCGTQRREFRLSDTEPLRYEIERSSARLAIIDPLSAYLGHSDSYKNAEIRALLAPLTRMAALTNVAIVLVTHLTKKPDLPVMYRASGSIAFVAVARNALAVTALNKQPGALRIITSVKSNLGPAPDPLGFSIGPSGLEWSRRTLSDADVQRGTTTAVDDFADADEVVAQLLTNAKWPIKSSDVYNAGLVFGISNRTMYNAAKRYAAQRGFRLKHLPKDGQWWMHRRSVPK
jgi:hypothetical protein